MLKRRTFFLLESFAVLVICSFHSYVVNHFDGLIGRALVNLLHSLFFGIILGRLTYLFAQWATKRGWVEESAFDQWLKAEKAFHQKRMIEVDAEIQRERIRIHEHRH